MESIGYASIGGEGDIEESVFKPVIGSMAVLKIGRFAYKLELQNRKD